MNTETQPTVIGSYDDLAHRTSPIGAIVLFAGADAPEGWLVCDGREILQKDYQALFKCIGTKWGKLSHSPFNQREDTISFLLPKVQSPALNLHYIIHAK
jgi:microcystin-dependent protein